MLSSECSPRYQKEVHKENMRNLALYLVPAVFLLLVGEAFSQQGLISVQSNCGNTALSNSRGRFTSPNYPSNYRDSENCYWLITSTVGSIHLIFESFSLESCCDYVRVYDGSSSSSRLLGQFNSNTLPPNLWSSSNQMYIKFTSDGSVTSSGFSAVFQGANLSPSPSSSPSPSRLLSTTIQNSESPSLSITNQLTPSAQLQTMIQMKSIYMYSSKLSSSPTPSKATMQMASSPSPPTTTQPTNVCDNYTELSSANRSVHYTTKTVECDQDDLISGWYRFTGAAGSQIATSCVPQWRCNTHAPGWMNGAHPTVDEGIVTRQVCYHWSYRGCCTWSNMIRVKNCSSFFVYELDKPPACSLRYCGENGTDTWMCDYHTCRNGGTCQDTPNGYNCTCPRRYTGQRCERRDNCVSSPCYNGGTCRSTRYGYNCSCPYGYSGSQCENSMCDYNTCRNGGTCRNRYYGYRCYCPQGYSGRHCETSVGCNNNNPCRNGGTCHHTYYGYIYCSCPRGYSGQHCETNLKTKVTCDTRYMEVELRRAFFPNLEWRSLHLNDPACRATRVTWSTIRLRTTLDGCGTNHTESNDMLEFSNEVKDDKSYLSPNQSVITRDGTTLLRFHCKYSRRQLVSTSFSPSKQTVHVSEGNFGNFTFTMNLFRSATYNNMYLPFEYPVVVSLNQPLWIQFKVTDATTADLVVLADYCHATTSTNPNSFPRHEFVRSGCALDSTMAYNYDPTSSVQDFSIKSFRFIHTSNKLVYLHCELMACHRNSTNSRCSRGCVSSRRRRRAAEDEEDTSEAYDLSVGPFLGQSSGNGNSKATDDTKQTNAAMATGLGVVGSLLVLVCAVLVATKLYPWYKTRCSSPDVTVNSYENGSPADIDEKHEACEMQVKT